MQEEIVTHFSAPTSPSLGHTEKLIGSSLFFLPFFLYLQTIVAMV